MHGGEARACGQLSTPGAGVGPSPALPRARAHHTQRAPDLHPALWPCGPYWPSLCQPLLGLLFLPLASQRMRNRDGAPEPQPQGAPASAIGESCRHHAPLPSTASLLWAPPTPCPWMPTAGPPAPHGPEPPHVAPLPHPCCPHLPGHPPPWRAHGSPGPRHPDPTPHLQTCAATAGWSPRALRTLSPSAPRTELLLVPQTSPFCSAGDAPALGSLPP